MWSSLDSSDDKLPLSNMCNQSINEVHDLESKHLSAIYNSSLCPDCFYASNHVEHDANMFRSLGGGVCDCGDGTVMKTDGFCKHHGPSRISNGQVSLKYIRTVQIILPRLIIYFLSFSLLCDQYDEQ